MSSPWGRCQVWHHAGHHQDRLHRAGLDLGSLRTLPSSLPTQQRQGQVSSWQAPWHAERGRRATVTPLSECHVTVWHPLSREAWHMLGHDCDLQTDQTLRSPPGGYLRILSSTQTRRAGIRYRMESTGVLGTLWVKFHKRLSPMFHLEHTVSKPSKSDKSIRAWAHSASPLFSISGTCAGHSVKLWLAASVWYDISLLRYPLPPSLALSHSPRINALFSHFESGSSSSNSAATDCYYRITIYFRLL